MSEEMLKFMKNEKFRIFFTSKPIDLLDHITSTFPSQMNGEDKTKLFMNHTVLHV